MVLLDAAAWARVGALALGLLLFMRSRREASCETLDERLRRECARARRYDRGLALVLLDAEGGPSAYGAAGDRILGAVRGTDVAAHLGDGLFAVLLPEAAQGDAERLHRRLRFALGGRVDDDDAPWLRAGLVDLRREDDAGTFFARAEAALERARQAASTPLAAVKTA